jgi:hypothetical protein
MPILLLIFGAGLVYLIVERQGSAAGSLLAAPAPQALTTPPPTYSAPVPTGNGVLVGGVLADELAPVAINDVTQQATSSLAKAGSSLASVVPIVGGIVSAVAGALLAQHTARLQHATSENAAVAKVVPSWIADLQGIAQAVTSRQISRAQAMQYVAQVDQQVKSYLQSHVGPSGTAWNGAPTGCPGTDVAHSSCLDGGNLNGSCSGPHNCDKQCTVGCCIYYSYIEPANDCFVKRLARGGAQKIGVPTIPGNKYGFPSIPGVTISFTS